jgi:hypothetical protein
VPAARKLCRYALSCEYSRQRITRVDIGTKVLPNNSGRMFKAVFAEAQNMLRETFGMELIELPKADKVTVQQKRGMTRSVDLMETRAGLRDVQRHKNKQHNLQVRALGCL